VTIDVYSKVGCGICEKAKEKLSRMGLEFSNRELMPAIDLHSGWREDGSVEVLSAYAWIEGRLPVIRIDEGFHDYPGAMRRLKALGEKAAAGAARSESAVH
jgi:glutaredoxin